MKVALIQDWFVINGGAEKVVREILYCYPKADVFSLVDFLTPKDRDFILHGKIATTSFIQHLPKAEEHYRNYLPFFIKAIESLDLSGYDLILSSSYAVAKGIRKTKSQIHICYCHSPMRYAHDLYHHYLYETGLSPIKRLAAKLILPRIKRWDIKVSNRVDFFIANSNFIKERIKKAYGRNSTVIYPPVDVSSFALHPNKKGYFLCYGRQVPYKKTNEIVRAFSALPNKKLVVAGGGPEVNNLKSIAPKNVDILGELSFNNLIELVQQAKALVVAAEEDFGITPLEAQATGTPVIALKKGGYLETVVEGKTGIFFEEATKNAIQSAVLRFEEMEFNSEECRSQALKFSSSRFQNEFFTFVQNKIDSKIA